MPKMLFVVMTFLLGGAIKRMVVGAGLGFIAHSFLSVTFKWFLERSVYYMNSGSSTQAVGYVLSFLGMARIDQCLSLIASAVVARIAINAMTLSLTRK